MDSVTTRLRIEDSEGMDNETLIEIFKLSPAIAALLIVIVLLYRIIVKKEETIQQLTTLGREDQLRQAKMITLLEILVNRGGTP